MTQPPSTFGRYSLEKKLAQGGMAEIFLARFQGESGFEKKVIIKRILPRYSQNQDFIRMLVHEAKIAVRLHHANIVQIFDLGRVGEHYFISMEYVMGRDLRTILSRLQSRRALLPQEIAVYIARESCKGLEYAHGIKDDDGQLLNLVHRDISPPNLLLSLDGEVKIIDFGIAKATARATDTQAGVFKGKFSYMSPEQARGQKIDRRTDIFAMGLCLYEMLMGKKLLEGETDVETLERAKGVDRLKLGLTEAGIPSELERIVRRALAGDRDVRYQTSGEMARELSVYLNVKYPTFTEQDASSFMKELFARGQGVSTGDVDAALAMSLVGTFGDIGAGDLRVSSTTENLAGTGGMGGRLRQEALHLQSADDDIATLDDLLEPEPDANPRDAQGWVQEMSNRFDTGDSGTFQPVLASSSPSTDHSVEGTLLSGIANPREETQIGAGSQGLSNLLKVAVLGVLVVVAALGALVLAPRSTAEALPSTFHEVRQDGRRVLGLPILSPVLVSCEPSGCQVFIDGVLKGDAGAEGGELNLLLPQGETTTVEVRKEGFKSGTVAVAPEREFREVEVSLTLEPLVLRGGGTIRVESSPPGARLTIVNGPEVQGLTPIEVGELSTDIPLKLLLSLDNYQTWEGEITPLEGSIETIKAVLEQEPVRLTLTTDPEGSSIFLDDRLSGRTPLQEPLLLLPDSVYNLRVERPGHKSYTQALKTVLGENLNISVNLTPVAQVAKAQPKATRAPEPKAQAPVSKPPPAVTKEPEAPQAKGAELALVGIVVIPSSPETTIYVDGVKLGTAPIKAHGLAAGEYLVRLENQTVGVDQTLPKKIRSEDIGGTLTWEFEITPP